MATPLRLEQQLFSLLTQKVKQNEETQEYVQMKEQDKTLERKLDVMEISNLPDKSLK